MKIWEKLILGTIILAMSIFLIAAVYDLTDKGYPGAQSSGLQTGSAVIASGSAWLTGFQILTYNTATVTVTIFDNATTGAGTVLAKGVAIQADYGAHFPLSIPVRASLGIYCTIAGTGGNAVVHYRQ